MSTMAQNSELMLFITHVETDGPLLKIWGQIDRNAATCVERMILPLSEKFAQGLGLPNPSFPLPLNMICCARFQNDGYYRAKICAIQPTGNVLVHFIDYGNFEILPPTAIRLLDNIPSAVSLHSLPPLALDFILANVLPVGGVWETETIESIKQSLRYADLKGMLHSVIGSHRMLKLCYNNEDFGDLLVSKNLAVSVSLQDMFSSRRQVPQQTRAQTQPQQYPRDNMAGYSSPRTNPAHNNSVGAQEDWRNSQQRQPPPHVPEALVFKTRVLDVGSVHDVYVSYVEDGPLKFAIQVQSTSEILKQLMNEINSYPTAPLQEPPLPGSVCLGRYSKDKVLCRAVVMAVMEHKCKLYYVDFGHTEVLSYSDIFQLPPQYINPRVLSIRFTLSGLKDMVITEETKEYFKKIVTGKPLVLQVRPPEGPPLIQYGDLYENRINIRDLLKENSAANSAAVFYQEPLRLKRGAKEIVHVSFVESCAKFFVQLDTGVKSLNSVMACLAEYAKSAPQLNEKSLQVGSPCCASYGEDKQWYRAQILSMKGDQVTVLYVDYGNEETVSVSSLRQIHTNLVTNLRSQAIKCALNGFQSSQFNQETANQFELIVLEKKLAMEVVEALPQASIVELFDCGVVPMVNIASKLQSSHPATRGGGSMNSSINSQKEGEQVLNSSRSPDRKHHQGEERNSKWGRNSKPNTWGQESRAGDWNARARSNNYEGKEQLDEKSRTKIVKDVENEQRQRENNRHDGEDRLHQKETRNNHFNRNDNGGNRFERNEDNGSRRARGNRFGSGGRTPREDNRFDKNTSKDDSWSDRDSDTSSRGSGKRGSKGPRGIKGRTDRGGRRAGDRKTNSGKWSDGESDRSSQKSNQSTGFRSKERNSSNPSWKNSKTQPTKTGTWNSMSPTSPVKETPRLRTLRIPPPNITVGAVKTSEVIYTVSPTDFYVQLCPDNLELAKLMENITQKYSNGGTNIRKSEIQPGTSCIAQYSFDSTWYRAVIKTNDGDSATVHFIDYGNTETVGHDKIKELQPEFARLSAQAVHCKLFAAEKSTWSDEEIDEFAQAAEGVSLEAEFLSQDNGTYAVLLKPTADNGSENNYVNKLFCGNTDLEQARRDLKDKAKGGGKKTQQILQCIPPGQKWGDEVFSPGFQVDVVVTWFVNPNNFYCQILNKQSEFRSMMNNIQESYGEQLPIRNTLQIGDPVIAFFSDDGALYRAEIKELNKLRGHIVQYVDFGNRAMVDPCKIYPVEKRFAVLPKQAMHCSLKDVAPPAGGDWSKANKHAIDKYFDADKYLCTFHGTKDGKYLISLNSRGKDIGDEIIRAGLAANPETRKEVIVDKVVAPEQNQAAKDTEKQDLTLWNGQMIRTIVINVQGAGKFYIRLPMDLEQNSTTADQDHLVESYLFDVTPTAQIDETLRRMEGKDAIVDIKDVKNQRFAVDLYDVIGKKVKLVESDPDVVVSPVCPLPVSAATTRVWITHIENSEKIWLQRASDSDNIAELLNSLYEHYSASGTPLTLEVGKLCAAESSDKNWYRAKIEALTESETAQVRFIDYGNSEEVPKAAIKTLGERFYTPHEMALRVSLVVSLKGTDEEQRKVLQENLSDKELTADFHKVDNKWLVELTENDKKFSERFSELNLVAEFRETEPQKQEEIAEMIVGNRYKVYLSHSDSPAQFWLQRNEEIDAIEEMQSSLQILAPDFPPLQGVPEEGTLCAALYSADSMWYRAEVLDADEDIITVRFIDYGNTDVIDSNSTSIKDLPQSWKDVKKYGLKSRLDLIPTGAEDWSSASCEMFEKLATASADPITALIIADSVPRRVELFVDGENSVGDSLVREGHAIMVHNAEDLIDEIIDLELDPRSAFVSHVNSPSEFWVQEEKSVSDLEMMTDRFIVVEMFPKLDEIVEGTLCVAKFPDDDQWYRARVKSHSPSGTEVLYIDYGNSAVSTEVRALPEDLAAVAPLSRKCCLELPPGVKDWSEKACEKFIDLAAEGATIFLLDVVKEGETSVVSLNLDGVNVADQLAKLCDSLPVIDERLPPLGEENSPYIFVSHVNSPGEFWTQAESSINELETMASRLMDAESLLPLNNFEEGTICAAKFPEDEAWYRARILEHGEAGTNVLYFDYGSSALATELRILPEDVANIPSLAMRCRLLMPDDVEEWSEEAADKFNEIVADGATMFQFEILDQNDPKLIALQLEGTDVVELLKPLCKLKSLKGETEGEIAEPLESRTLDKESKIEETVQEAGVTEAENAGINLPDEAEKLETVNADVAAVGEAPVGGTDEQSEIKVTEADKVQITETAQTSTDILDVVIETEKGETLFAEKLASEVKMTEEISEPCETGEKVELEEPKTTIAEAETEGKESETVAAIDEEKIGETAVIIPEAETEGKNSETTAAIDEEKMGEPAVSIPEVILPKVEIGEEKPETAAAIEEEKIGEPVVSIPEAETEEKKSETAAAIEEKKIGEPTASIRELILPKVEIKEEPETASAIGEEKIGEPAVSISEVILPKVEIKEEEPEAAATIEEEKAAVVVKKEPEELAELTVDDIVGNMVKVALVDGADAVNIGELTEGENLDESIVVESEKPEKPAREEVRDLEISTPQKTPKIDKIVPGSISRGSMEEDIPLTINLLGRRRSSCSEERIVPGGINKGNDLTEAEIVDLVSPEKISAPEKAEVKGEASAAVKTPAKIAREEKILPGSISRGESPTVELNRPSTPKTPHSEKLLAGVVNLQETLAEFEEHDEILTVEVENNIPENGSA